MRLNASCEIDLTAPQPTPAIFMLRPRSGMGQWVSMEQYDFDPRVPVIEFTDTFGNLCQRVVIPAGVMKLRATCIVEAAEVMDADPEADFVPPQYLPDTVLPFVLPSRYCPSDVLGNLAHEVTAGARPGYCQAEAIRSWIQQNIRYQYGASNTATTAADTARERSGVCRDFTHLGLALCRALNIPARMVVGYASKVNEPDLHAWFEAYVGTRWYCFDATETKTSGCRIAIAYGRDATDVAIVTQFGPLQIDALRVKVTEII